LSYVGWALKIEYCRGRPKRMSAARYEIRIAVWGRPKSYILLFSFVEFGLRA
jgi:hypothetical protein